MKPYYWGIVFTITDNLRPNSDHPLSLTDLGPCFPEGSRRAFFKAGGSLTPGNDMRVSPGMTVRWPRAATVLSRNCCADFRCPLAKKVMSNLQEEVRVSRHHRGRTLYLSQRCGIPPPLPLPPPLKSPRSQFSCFLGRTFMPTAIPCSISQQWLQTSRDTHTLSWTWEEQRTAWPSKQHQISAIRTEILINENLEILFRFRNGKANEFPQIFFHSCFRNGHVGHAQATTTGHTFE